MTLRVSRSGAIALALALGAAAALFLFFLARFGGPSLDLGSDYTLTAAFPDTSGLSVRSEVLDRGVHVGEVQSIDVEGSRALVTVSLDDAIAPVHRDATMRVGEKTLFGESFVDLDPGRTGSGELDSGSTLQASQVLSGPVDVDEALKVLNAPARRNLQDVLGTLGESAAAPGAEEEISQTYGQLANLTARLRGLADTLHGQEGQIATGVNDANTVFRTLGVREGQIRQIVSGARATLGALARQRDSLRAGIAELPALLESARSTLLDVRPLLTEARPVTRHLAAAAPALGAALNDVPATVRSANSLLDGVPELRQVALPFLSETSGVLSLARPAEGPLSVAMRNLVPIVRFLSRRRDTIAAWFSNTGDLGSHRDSTGYFARFFVSFEPGSGFGTKGQFQNNSYTRPHDAAHNQPYSGYPRLMPYQPKQGGTP
jgi:phospholipid/cholesterol/gamma-HCH transport system substrate-binding protein